MLRKLLIVLLCCFAVATCVREPKPRPNKEFSLNFIPVELPQDSEILKDLGPFQLEAIWEVRGGHDDFQGFSSLALLPSGQLLSATDSGSLLRFTPPTDADQHATDPHAQFQRIFDTAPGAKALFDAESLTVDPATETFWIGWEGSNSLSRHNATLTETKRVRPAAMANWGTNSGPEAFERLMDGRFLVISEGAPQPIFSHLRPALLFSEDPITAPKPIAFKFSGPKAYAPTDMTQLPDGRVLILMRRLIWPMPFRFTAKIVIADPANIQAGKTWHSTELAHLTWRMPVDNMEGMAIQSLKDGRVALWIISDNNQAISQRTLLWKLTFNPQELLKP